MTVLWLGKLLLAALIAVCLLQLLRGKAGALTPLCSLAVCAVMVGAMLAPLSALWQKWQALLTRSGVEISLFLPLVKVLGITAMTRLSAELCRDAGEKAIAAGVELGGAAAALVCAFPLAEKALSLIGTLGA